MRCDTQRDINKLSFVYKYFFMGKYAVCGTYKNGKQNQIPWKHSPVGIKNENQTLSLSILSDHGLKMLTD